VREEPSQTIARSDMTILYQNVYVAATVFGAVASPPSERRRVAPVRWEVKIVTPPMLDRAIPHS